jgi:hypothetical protein
MQTKYAVFNPLDGSYTILETIEEATTAASEIAYNFYYAQAGGSPVNTIEIDDNGGEVWKDVNGQRFLSPAEIQARIDAKLKSNF